MSSAAGWLRTTPTCAAGCPADETLGLDFVQSAAAARALADASTRQSQATPSSPS